MSCRLAAIPAETPFEVVFGRRSRDLSAAKVLPFWSKIDHELVHGSSPMVLVIRGPPFRSIPIFNICKAIPFALAPPIFRFFASALSAAISVSFKDTGSDKTQMMMMKPYHRVRFHLQTTPSADPSV